VGPINFISEQTVELHVYYADVFETDGQWRREGFWRPGAIVVFVALPLQVGMHRATKREHGVQTKSGSAEPGAHGEAVLGVGAGGATPSRHGGPGV
jgi:hypothetical protein